MKNKTPFANIEFLTTNGGTIEIGDATREHSCIAVACDEDQQLALLKRKENETLQQLLYRLDCAIESAWEEQNYINELNN